MLQKKLVWLERGECCGGRFRQKIFAIVLLQNQEDLTTDYMLMGTVKRKRKSKRDLRVQV